MKGMVDISVRKLGKVTSKLLGKVRRVHPEHSIDDKVLYSSCRGDWMSRIDWIEERDDFRPLSGRDGLYGKRQVVLWFVCVYLACYQPFKQAT